MKILAIETSCDETAIAVVSYINGKFKILSNVISSQIKIHKKWGGVVPSLAKREHQRNLPLVLNRALKKAGFAISNFQFPISKQKTNSKSQIPNIDAVAVTVGPGLEPALWTGINFAQELAEKWNKPIVPVNHMEGHIISAFLSRNEFTISNLQFPILALLVSGGHTELVLMSTFGKYKIIGQTRDDAVGEAFDKVARMLGLPYPGGPVVAKMATKFSISKSQFPKINLPRPMIHSKDYDFSFSGLKTAVLYLLRDLNFKAEGADKKIKKKPFGILPRRDRDGKRQFFDFLIPEICHEFQQAVIDVLIKKTLRAVKEYKVKTLILGGGVVANQELRKQFSHQLSAVSPQVNLLLPEIKFTGDNAAMIGAATCLNIKKAVKYNSKALKANGNLKLS